jgi:hypothetical protein
MNRDVYELCPWTSLLQGVTSGGSWVTSTIGCSRIAAMNPAIGALTFLSPLTFAGAHADKNVGAPRAGSWRTSTVREPRIAIMNAAVADVSRR